MTIQSIGIRLFVFIPLILILISDVQAADKGVFVDPRLDNWSSMSGKSRSIADEFQKVIVFVKQPKYQNRSGEPLGIAKLNERDYLTSYVSEVAQRSLANTNFLLKAKPEVLWTSQAFITYVDRAALAALAANDEIEGIIENTIIQLEEPISSKGQVKADERLMTYGLQSIKAESAWKQGITGKGVVIGVIDTGVEQDHPDLAGKVVLTKDFTTDNNTTDHHGHGTHVSGTIAGGKASGKAIGVAPDAKIMMAKVFNRDGGATMEGLLKAMEWFVDPDGDPSTNDAPRVVSNSWGSNTQFTYGFRNIIRTWRRFEIFPNFAAGNSGSMYFSVNAPGAYPFSYAVGALDENSIVTSFSSRGPTLWWKTWYPVFYTKPNISAPGLEVLSAYPGKTWVRMSGTSMATPHVAGVLALMLQTNPHLSIEDMQQILDTTAQDLGSRGKDNRYGTGIVQVDQVVERARSWQKTLFASSFRDRDPSQWEWATP